ncbi:MAG: DUF3052 domain-containing protein [Chloroflexota bacterium]
MSGYSGTPLAKKLGIKAGFRVLVRQPPEQYHALVAPLPPGVTFLKRATHELDMIHIFTKSARTLEKLLPNDLHRIKQDGMIWVSWPKKASKVKTDMTEYVIRAVALPLGLVDVKVCAVDEVWSGLKLVIRKENRKTLS